MSEPIWKPSATFPCPVCGVGLTIGKAVQVERDTSTPEGRETWEAVEKAAAKAPEWLRREFEFLKHRLLREAAEDDLRRHPRTPLKREEDE